MITFIKGEDFTVQKNLDTGGCMYTVEEIFEQLKGTDRRISKWMDKARRDEGQSWENSRMRNSGL